MKKRWMAITCVLMLLASLCVSCGTGKKIKDTGTYIYYVDAEGTALEKDNYELKENEAKDEVQAMLSRLKNVPKDSIEYQPAIPEEVDVLKFELQDKQLSIYFSENYAEMKRSREVLCRAAVVQTLTQIGSVDFVMFYIGDVPLTNEDGEAIGLMQSDDFVQNTGSSINSYQVASLTLYFANRSGDKLVKESVSVRYNSSTSIEKLIVEQLMRGPATDEAKPTVTPKARLLSATVKDSICYVNFDEGFLESEYNLKPEIPIYSIVNSIVESGAASQVQISINGGTDVLYPGEVKLDKPLERNLDLVETQEADEAK